MGTVLNILECLPLISVGNLFKDCHRYKIHKFQSLIKNSAAFDTTQAHPPVHSNTFVDDASYLIAHKCYGDDYFTVLLREFKKKILPLFIQNTNSFSKILFYAEVKHR